MDRLCASAGAATHTDSSTTMGVKCKFQVNLCPAIYGTTTVSPGFSEMFCSTCFCLITSL